VAKVIRQDIGKFYQHYPKVAAVITAQADGRCNAMAAAWHTSLSFEPPIYGVSISPKRFTYQLIADSKEFGVNFLPFEKVEQVVLTGGVSGREIDKIQSFNIPADKPVKTGAPILKDAYAAYECRLIDDSEYGDHRWLVGEIVAVHVLEEAFTPDEAVDLNRITPVLYLARDIYVAAAQDTVRHIDREVCVRQALKED